MEKNEIIKILNEIGILLELKGENPFKSRAYYNGARILENLNEDLVDLVRENRLLNIEGIGKALSEKISTLVLTGDLPYYRELKESFPERIFELFTIPGLGPKKIKALFDDLGIQSMGELEYACVENRLIELKGFGKKSQDKILDAITHCKQYASHRLYYHGWEEANLIIEMITQLPRIQAAEIAGSLRRKKEVVKDIDILIASDNPEILDEIAKLNVFSETVSLGPQKGSFRTLTKTPVDVRLVDIEEFATALHHFTGSKEHNTQIRHLAKTKNMKINEYGIFADEKPLNIKSEEKFFKALGLDFIPPELREGLGEIEAAMEGKIPKLIDDDDILGVLHNHTTYSDGIDSLEDMVKEAIVMGFKYFGVGDHSKAAFFAKGLSIDGVKSQWEEIDRLQEKYPEIIILKGIESDILADGSLDYPDEILEGFDYIVASVHTNFKMDKDKMTERFIKAVENPYTTILGHLTGRLLLAREGYQLDIEKVLKACAKNNVVLEINSSPHRLDLDWRWVKIGREMGLKFAINPDAHKKERMDDFRHGVKVARKGWLTSADVINTYDVLHLKEVLKNKPFYKVYN